MKFKSTINILQVLVTLCAIVAAASAAPRYIMIPIEDVDMSAFNGQYLPMLRMPGLARQARQVELDDPRQGPQYVEVEDSQPAGSEGYGAPPHAAAPAGPDHVDYGAYTGGYGAFGWYTDHPVLLGPGH